jgi:hypothetical protein
MNIRNNLANLFFRDAIRQQVRAALATETDATFALGARQLNAAERDRYDYDRETLQQQALQAWRTNPLARRIVELTSQYVVGGGISLSSRETRAHAFLQAWWSHPLNQMQMRAVEWCDELTRSGELFFLISTDASGMSYLRAVPAGEIAGIEHAPNDVQQETAFLQKAGLGEEVRWQAAQALEERIGEDGCFPVVMAHYAINRPVGALRGESDLAPLLRWLSRYAAWLEDRARLNHFRTAFLYVVKARYAGDAERLSRQNSLNASPPSPGSILVTDESETWEVLNPELESGDAATDGLALKKMIAAGVGLPLHFLAEPESATRTTAEAAGGPTFRRFEQRQQFFLWMLGDLARIALHRRARLDGSLRGDAEVEVRGADLSARDNAALALASSTVISAFAQLYERGLINAEELLRLAYRFCGETADIPSLLARARAEGAKTEPAPWMGRPEGMRVNPESGEVSTGKEELWKK